MNPFKAKKAKKATTLVQEEVTPGWVYDTRKKGPMKICLVGDMEVGKKSAVAAMVNKKSIPPKTSVYDYHECKIKVGGDIFDVELMEADAGPHHDRLRGLSYPYVNVFLVCYSIVDRETLAHIEERWLKEIYGNTQFAPDGAHVPIVLCGTKLDLAPAHSKDKGRSKPITNKEAEFYRDHIGAKACVEISALTKRGLQEALVQAINVSLDASNDYDTKKSSLKSTALEVSALQKEKVPQQAGINFNLEGEKKKIVVDDSSDEKHGRKKKSPKRVIEDDF